MNRFKLLMAVLLLATSIQAQKAWPGDITAMLSRIPVPENSAFCYKLSTKTIDSSTGIISIRDNGPGFTDIETQLTKILSGVITDAALQSPGMNAPSADQVEQMKQQAMAQAAAARSMSPQQLAQQYRGAGAAPAPDQLALMKLIGQAQTAVGHINQLISELARKKAAIYYNLDTVKMGPVCPEVQQGGYAGPTCPCLQAREVAYRTRCTPVMDRYVGQMAGLYREYLPKMKAETLIVDDMESKAYYGDAVSNPAYRQIVLTIQRQAFTSVTTMMSLSGVAWKDSADQYALLMNARSGASVPCNRKPNL
jgi:hypothetical protein